MTALFTWDVFTSLDGYGSFTEAGTWGGYWDTQGPELRAHRARRFADDQRMVYGATTSARSRRRAAALAGEPDLNWARVSPDPAAVNRGQR